MDKKSLILTLLHLKGWGAKRVYLYVQRYNYDYEKCVSELIEELNEEEKTAFKQELISSKKTIELNSQVGTKVCCILDKEFPKKLFLSSSPCVFLFYKGDISLLSQKSISIIGTRKPDSYFVEKGKIATTFFAKKGYVIVSGLALGCDTIAHSSCLEAGGKTIAVLPSPCDNVQPTSNRQLAQRIIENGGLLISEYSTGSTMTKFNYPQRDRIQSKLSEIILIIQANDQSGTMIATRNCLKDGKRVYAIKGNRISIVHNYVDIDSPEELEEITKWIF